MKYDNAIKSHEEFLQSIKIELILMKVLNKKPALFFKTINPPKYEWLAPKWSPKLNPDIILDILSEMVSDIRDRKVTLRDNQLVYKDKKEKAVSLDQVEAWAKKLK